jgi:hypothetical protein
MKHRSNIVLEDDYRREIEFIINASFTYLFCFVIVNVDCLDDFAMLRTQISS